MKRIKKLPTPPVFLSYSAVGGREEHKGSLSESFDFLDDTDKFGMDSWEKAEGEMGRICLNLALRKASLSHEQLSLLVAGDLQNQCVATSIGLSSFGIPFLGVYGACSTCTEDLIVLSSVLSLGERETGAALTSSHNSAQEMQFRTPLEYGAQRSPSAQWTSTAAGAFILTLNDELIKTKGEDAVVIKEVMPGRIIDGSTTDGANMGAAMAFAAHDSICSYFAESTLRPADFDYVVTGDLGVVGSNILKHLLKKDLPAVIPRHLDCGCLLYDFETQDVHSGASGCGTSAAVLACHFLPLLAEGKINRILFLSTGALLSPSSLKQGESIRGIAPAVLIERLYPKKGDNKE